MTLHSRIKRHLELGAGLTSLAAFLKVHPDLPFDGTITQTFPIASRADADQIAGALEARTTWRNGYYMAERDFSGLLRLEIHFVPPITEQDAA